jgi:hypothetical protein
MSSQYPGAQYPGPQHPGTPVPPPTSGRRGGLALIGVILAAAAVALQFIGVIVQALLLGTRAYDLLGAVSGVVGILSALLAVGAVVLGGLALARKERPGLAGIAIGAGGALVIGEIGSLLYTALIPVVTAY